MSILKTPYREIRAKETKVTGVVLPVECYSYLSLYCLARGMTKARAVREIIYNWRVETQRIHPSCAEDSLVLNLTQKVLLRWKEKKEGGESLTNFRSKMKQELLTKGVSQEVAQKILNHLK